MFAYSLATSCRCLTGWLLLTPILIVILLIPTAPIAIPVALLAVISLTVVASLSITFPIAPLLWLLSPSSGLTGPAALLLLLL